MAIPFAHFPNLASGSFQITSGPDRAYNCIAWAADADTQNWWLPHEDGYWPPGVPREPTLDAFIQAYTTLGYSLCGDGGLEPGFEKIAIYANRDEPSHAAKQLVDGRWTSKLGEFEDITHDTLDRLNSPIYGRAIRFLQRPRR